MSSLADQLAAKKKSGLRETITHIRTSTGALYEERKDPKTGKLVKIHTGQQILPAFQTQAALGYSTIPAWTYGKLPTTTTTTTATADAKTTTTTNSKSTSGGGSGGSEGWYKIPTLSTAPKPSPPSQDTKQTTPTPVALLALTKLPPLPSQLSVVSYNVWFADVYWMERARGLFAIIETLAPHVICLQEVTPRFLHLLSTQSWCQQHYIMSDVATVSSATATIDPLPAHLTFSGGNTVNPYVLCYFCCPPPTTVLF